MTQQSTNDAAVPPRMERLIFPNVPVCKDRIAKFEAVSIQFTNVEETENQAASRQRFSTYLDDFLNSVGITKRDIQFSDRLDDVTFRDAVSAGSNIFIVRDKNLYQGDVFKYDFAFVPVFADRLQAALYGHSLKDTKPQEAEKTRIDLTGRVRISVIVLAHADAVSERNLFEIGLAKALAPCAAQQDGFIGKSDNRFVVSQDAISILRKIYEEDVPAGETRTDFMRKNTTW